MQFIENGSIMEYKYLIIPDIHGRTFWRKPLEALAERVESIIFLGDYFDPYPSEGIGEDDAIENWKEMTIFIDDNGLSERTTMLIGNHDVYYLNNIFGIYGGSTRKSMEHKTEIASLLRERNLVLAFDGKTEGKKVLFTHAGVNHNWFLRHEKQIGSLTADNINTLTDNDEGWVALSEVGSIRGGFHPTGSPLWLDVREQYNTPWPDGSCPYDFQVFGHTKGREPVIENDFAMLDCQQCFVMAHDGTLSAVSDIL